MYWLDKYKDDLNEIVDLVWLVYQGEEVFPRKSHLVTIHKNLVASQSNHQNMFALQREDISQELTALWIHYNNKFQEKQRKTSLRDYLLQCSAFGISLWFEQQMKQIIFIPQQEPPTEGMVQEFTLDLKFLFEGTHCWPLYDLSPYERYLLFLKFKEEKTIVDIAYIVQKHREVVSRQLTGIINKLRRVINEKSNTGRSCSSRSRL